MAVANERTFVRYSGDNIQRRFSVPFVCQDTSHLIVYTIGKKGEKKYLTSDVEYTCEQVEGSAVVLLTNPIEMGVELVIARDIPVQQELVLSNGNPIDGYALTHTLDSIVYMIQDTQGKLTRLFDEGEVLSPSDVYTIQKDIEEKCQNVLENKNIVEHAVETVASYTKVNGEIISKVEDKERCIEGYVKKVEALLEECRQLHAQIGGGGDAMPDAPSYPVQESIPAGCIAYFATQRVPEGWLLLEKKGYLRSEYPELAKAIYCGTSNNATAEYGFYFDSIEDPEGSRSVDGKFFMLGPEVRGEFIRCFDAERGFDEGRILGSLQDARIPKHTHELYTYEALLAWGMETVYMQKDGEKAILESKEGEEGSLLYPQNIALLACIKY